MVLNFDIPTYNPNPKSLSTLQPAPAANHSAFLSRSGCAPAKLRFIPFRIITKESLHQKSPQKKPRQPPSNNPPPQKSEFQSAEFSQIEFETAQQWIFISFTLGITSGIFR